MTEKNNRPDVQATTPDEPDDLQYVVHHTNLPETRFSTLIDGAVKKVGDLASWFWVLLMLVICANVFSKNVLGLGSVRLEEIQWHIYSAVFILGLSYTLVFDDHVRVDFIHESLSLRKQAWVEFAGILVFLVPFVVTMIYFTFPFALKAYEDGERSISPAGLSNYWILKSVLLVGFALLLIAALARLHRCIALLFFGAEPKKEMDD